MNHALQAVKVTDKVYWVGAIDWTLRDFHGYQTQRGSTYNAYLIMADRITLVDTVKAPFADEMFARIASVVDPEKIDVIVSNHTEMDHSGSLPEAIRRCQPSQVYASQMGVKGLNAHFDLTQEIIAVKEGQTIDLGGASLTFVETRMIHWPDSMFSYLAQEKLLFSSDGFGSHLASSERFADQLAPDIVEFEARKYYANILMHLSPLIAKLLDKVGKMGLPIDIIAPDHGPIYRRPEDIQKVIGWYAKWAEHKPARKAVVLYGTMWKSTAAMAQAIAEGLASRGIDVKLMEMGPSHRSDVATEVLDAGALVVGSSTLNNQMLPAVADVLTYLKGLRPTNLIGAAFGSYGWTGEAVAHVADVLRDMKVDLVAEPLKCAWVPGNEDLTKCFDLGVSLADRLKAVCKDEG